MHYTLGEQLLDLAENSVEAGASRVEIEWDQSPVGEGDGLIRIRIRDNGSGMDAETVARVTDPFYTDGTKHADRAVGLGLAFVRQTTDAVGGRLQIDSEPGRGTELLIELPADHVDVPPAGDIVETIGLLLCMGVGRSGAEIVVQRRSGSESYRVTRSELEDVLEDMTTVSGRMLLREFLRSQEDEIWQR